MADITKVKPKVFANKLGIRAGSLDLLAGCPPCQGFSRLKAKFSKVQSKDKRNDLVLEYIRFVKELKPKSILLENVPGLKTDRRFSKIKLELEKLGYNLDYGILDAANYGVPQRRKRFILIGSRIKKVKLANTTRIKKTVSNAFAGMKKAGNSGDWMHDTLVEYRKDVLNIIKRIPKNGGSRSDLPYKYQLPSRKKQSKFNDVYSRMHWNKPAPTITGGCTSASKGRFIHPTENRAITLREAAILQGFRKSYKFPKNTNRQNLARLIGNAFPPQFTKAHAKVFIKY